MSRGHHDQHTGAPSRAAAPSISSAKSSVRGSPNPINASTQVSRSAAEPKVKWASTHCSTSDLSTHLSGGRGSCPQRPSAATAAVSRCCCLYLCYFFFRFPSGAAEALGSTASLLRTPAAEPALKLPKEDMPTANLPGPAATALTDSEGTGLCGNSGTRGKRHSKSSSFQATLGDAATASSSESSASSCVSTGAVAARATACAFRASEGVCGELAPACGADDCCWTGTPAEHAASGPRGPYRFGTTTRPLPPRDEITGIPIETQSNTIRIFPTSRHIKIS